MAVQSRYRIQSQRGGRPKDKLLKVSQGQALTSTPSSKDKLLCNATLRLPRKLQDTLLVPAQLRNTGKTQGAREERQPGATMGHMLPQEYGNIWPWDHAHGHMLPQEYWNAKSVQHLRDYKFHSESMQWSAVCAPLEPCTP